MKKYLLVVLFFSTVLAVHAQQKSLKIAKAAFFMPDGSFQKIYIASNESGIQVFKRISQENSMNMDPVSLTMMPIPVGKRMRFGDMPIVSESYAYRFLANQLCEKCQNTKRISKSLGCMMLVEDPDGTMNLVEVIWLSELNAWSVSIAPHVNLDHSFTSRGRPVFN